MIKLRVKRQSWKWSETTEEHRDKLLEIPLPPATRAIIFEQKTKAAIYSQETGTKYTELKKQAAR